MEIAIGSQGPKIYQYLVHSFDLHFGLFLACFAVVRDPRVAVLIRADNGARFRAISLYHTEPLFHHTFFCTPV